MASLEGKVDPSDLLILHEEVGTLQSEQDDSIQCAVAQLKLTSSSGKFTLSYTDLALAPCYWQQIAGDINLCQCSYTCGSILNNVHLVY